MSDDPICAQEGAIGLGGAFSEPGGSEACIQQNATLSCPSYLGLLETARGSSGELDVLVGQLGTDGSDENGHSLNDQVYLSAYRSAGASPAETRPEVVPPYSGLSTGPQEWALVSANDDGDTQLINQAMQGDRSTLTWADLFGSEASAVTQTIELSRGPAQSVVGYNFSSSNTLVAQTVDFATSVIELSSAGAEAIKPSFRPSRVALAQTSDGTRLGLLLDAMTLRLVRGTSLDETIFERELSEATREIDLHVLSEGSTAALLYLNKDGQHVVLYVSLLDGTVVGEALIPQGFNTCDNWFVGVVCDRCPVGTACTESEEFPQGARLYSVGARTFVATVTKQVLIDKVIENDTGVGGLGCLCSAKESQRSAPAALLVIHEVGVTDGRLGTSERGRYVTGAASVDYVAFERNHQGLLDIVMGYPVRKFEEGLLEFPQIEVSYRILGLGSAQADDSGP